FAVAESNVPRLTQLISVGLRNGASPRKITNLLQDVMEGTIKYIPRPSVERRSIDLSLICYNLGGRKLLHAMSHGLGLPSLRTLRAHMGFTRIMPTIGTVCVADILHNIREVVLKPREMAGHTEPRGVNLMIDEVALEERAVHFRHTNQVGGLCWRHSPLVDLVLRSYEQTIALAKAIKDGKVHLANEMTVVALSCFGENGTYPILALPSCKQVNAEDSGTIYQVVMAAWDEAGAAKKVGPIWSWATDGDVRRRVSGYEHFVSQKLKPTSPIYGMLAGMAGLNLYTGMNEITLDFDYKHIFKRICTLIRSPGGIALNNGRIITWG
ncbi:hypothetical protein FB451DRAFT_1056947, partial [Mycena latifolia]